MVENFLTSKSGRPELKAEHVRFANVCRRVVVYDVDLAWEVFFSAMVLGYTFGRLVLKKSK